VITGKQKTLFNLLRQDEYDLISVAAHSFILTQPILYFCRRSAIVFAVCHTAYPCITNIPHWFDGVLAVSKAAANNIEYCPGKRGIIYNGVDCQLFHPGEEPVKQSIPTLLWVGHPSNIMKNFHVFVLLMGYLTEENYNFLIVGGGEGQREALLLNTYLSDRLKIISNVEHQDMPKVYSDIAASGGVLIVTSKSETSPLMVLEAMASGVPVVAPNVGGIPEIIEDGKTGFLYSHTDGLSGLISALKKAMDPTMRHKVVWDACQEVRARFRLSKIAEDYYSYLVELTNISRKNYRYTQNQKSYKKDILLYAAGALYRRLRASYNVFRRGY
jgi:glycosyltransferase involved in cell wall biosynthesis